MNLEIKTYKTKESEEYKETQELRNKAIEYKSELYLEKWLKEIKIKQKEEKDLFYFIDDRFSEEGDSFSDDKDKMESESKSLALTKLIKREGFKARKDFTHFCPSTGYPIYSEYRVELFDEKFRQDVLNFLDKEKGIVRTNIQTLKKFFQNIENEKSFKNEILFFQLEGVNYSGNEIKNIRFRALREESVFNEKYIDLGI